MISSDRRRRTTEQWLEVMGAGLRDRRIRAELSQEELAELAGLGLNAVRNLESGSGANLASLVKVVRALGGVDWLAALALPVEPEVSPLPEPPQQRRTAPQSQLVSSQSA